MADIASFATVAVAGTFGIAGALIGARSQRRHSAEIAEREKSERAKERVHKYQEPLVRSAYDLQSRLFNLVERDGLHALSSDAYRTYVTESTAWLFGQYFGWVEIIRREAQFLVFDSADRRREVQATLAAISKACASDSTGLDPLFQVHRSNQRALGELMIIDGLDATGAGRTDCMGLARFTREFRNSNSEVRVWFGPLAADVAELAVDPTRFSRLLEVQNRLIDLVDAIDPEDVRFNQHRDRLRR